jgi:DNA-binding NarL/FixJ family response regulator
LVKWKLDLVIIDLDMGKGADGLDLLKETDAKHSSIRFWIVSSGMTNGIAAVAKELGAEQAISKSILLQTLKENSLIA